ncbi:MAG: hypothetical protein WD042_09320 [Phycisphaeraceae bacterium]
MLTPDVPSSLPFRDRRTALIVAGILLILIGALSGCMAALIPVGLLLANLVAPDGRAGAVHVPDVRSITMGVVLYLLVALLFVWLGVGSIRARRWVRSIALSVAWMWLIMGAISLASFILTAGDIEATIAASMQAQGQGKSLDTSTLATIAAVAVVASAAFIAIFFIALPLAMVLFYQSRHVQATLVHYNPQPGWTDRVPVIVLATSLGLALGVISMPVGLLYGVMPFFGTLLEGPAAWAAILVSTLILAALAWGIYRQSVVAWWATVLLSALAAVSTILTFSRVEFIEVYRHMGLAEHDLAILREQRMLQSPFVVVSTLVMTIAWLIFLVAIRKHFCPESCKR